MRDETTGRIDTMAALSLSGICTLVLYAIVHVYALWSMRSTIRFLGVILISYVGGKSLDSVCKELDKMLHGPKSRSADNYERARTRKRRTPLVVAVAAAVRGSSFSNEIEKRRRQNDCRQHQNGITQQYYDSEGERDRECMCRCAVIIFAVVVIAVIVKSCYTNRRLKTMCSVLVFTLVH